MKAYAMTGGIASGKSTVTRLFGELGAQTGSADQDARTVLEAGSPTRAAVLTAFPEACAPDGSLDRAALGARIFADPEARQRLNSLMHPAIRLRMRAAIDAAHQDSSTGLLIYEVPLLYEGGLETWFDGVIAVLANPTLQAERLQARETLANHPPLTPEAISERLAAQMPPEEKARRANFVIRTDTSLEETRQQVHQVWAQITGCPSY